MRAANPNLIVWIDTETTGLDPDRDLLLEIAVVVTDNSLRELGATSVVVAPEHGVEEALARMDPFVTAMHSSNGLISELDSPAALPLDAADRWIAAHIDQAAAGAAGPFLLGGNSITHDRGFLDRYAPQTFSRLHYRSIDVSSIEQDMVRDGYADEIAAERRRTTPAGNHRALGDIRDSVSQLASLREIRRSVMAHV